MNKKTDIGRAFSDLIEATFINYGGVLIEKLKDGYKVLGVVVKNWKEVDEVIESSYKNFRVS